MSTILHIQHAETPSRALDAEHGALRVWLQLLTCTTLIERHVRERLRERFDITLPRFDMMAQLDREPRGLKMSELSRRLMVTGGNVTGLTDQLVAEGLVKVFVISEEADNRAEVPPITVVVNWLSALTK